MPSATSLRLAQRPGRERERRWARNHVAQRYDAKEAKRGRKDNEEEKARRLRAERYKQLRVKKVALYR